MNSKAAHSVLFIAGGCFFVLAWVANVSLGSVFIPFSEILNRIIGFPFSKPSWETIIIEYRLPKSITAILAGISLALGGLQMQAFFRNPLAGPYVLGISSGAGLGVAFWLMAGAILPFMGSGPWQMFLAAGFGSLGVLALISAAALKVKDSMTLLIIGLMIGSFTSAVVALLAYFSEAEQLKLFTIWSMGSLGSTGWSQLEVFAIGTFLGILPLAFSVKSYNAMLLGENYAQSMGVNTARLRWSMIVSTGLLTGTATAFCGPIGFVGIAVPHLVRLLFRTANHAVLAVGSALFGANILLVCDIISQLPGLATTVPINIITSIMGAPVVIWLIFKKDFSKEFGG